jgi:3-deoxy-D-arabino-heptulosonate 7-phosphate (DAHP) synthase
VSGEDSGASIRVTDEQAADGKQSLTFEHFAALVERIRAIAPVLGVEVR